MYTEEQIGGRSGKVVKTRDRDKKGCDFFIFGILSRGGVVNQEIEQHITLTYLDLP